MSCPNQSSNISIVMKTNTKMTVTLLKQNAELIYELLCNAGWMDDADDLLAYIVEEEGKGAAEQKMAEVNDLINLINPLLDNPLDKIDEDLDTY